LSQKFTLYDDLSVAENIELRVDRRAFDAVFNPDIIFDPSVGIISQTYLKQ
jgi:hypothetical protein